MPNNFLLRIGNGNHFKSSSKNNIWGINSKNSSEKGFIKNAKEGDLLWFVQNKSNGQLIAVATFTSTKPRVLGPLIQLSLTNEELGWTESDGEWDTEVYYKDLYNLTDCALYSEIKGTSVIRSYNENCKVDLPSEYLNIVRYSKIKSTM